jgi:hypothetical protein
MNAIRWLFIETIEIRKANNLSSSDSYASIFILSLSLSLLCHFVTIVTIIMLGIVLTIALV